jgi:hypothetical protein
MVVCHRKFTHPAFRHRARGLRPMPSRVMDRLPATDAAGQAGVEDAVD